MQLFGKRLILLALAIIMAVSFSACGDEELPVVDDSSADISTSVPEDGSDNLPDPIYTYKKPNLTHQENYFTDVPYIGLYDACSLKAYYTESPDEHIYPASLTKMVTSMVALKYASPDSIFTAGSELDLVQPGSSIMWLGKGMRLSLEQLIYGLMLPSGNDAAYTVAVNVARSIEGNESLTDIQAVEYFCGLMNDFCAEIGATNSHFVNPEGWDDSRQYTTVRDLAVITSYALKNETIAKVVATPQISFVSESGHTFNLSNSNLLIHEDSEFYNSAVTGMKTGTTDFAGACLVATLSIDNDQYILIATGCPTNISRFETVTKLIEFAYRYHYANIFFRVPVRAPK